MKPPISTALLVAALAAGMEPPGGSRIEFRHDYRDTIPNVQLGRGRSKSAPQGSKKHGPSIAKEKSLKKMRKKSQRRNRKV